MAMFSAAETSELPDFNGLTIAEAFIQQVLQHPEVAAVSKQLLKGQPRHATIFSEGQAPGPTKSYSWRLHRTAKDLADDFVDQMVVSFDRPRPQPDQLEIAVAEATVRRANLLLKMLADGDLIAVGTHAVSGAESDVGRGQWKRSDLLIDLENSSICELHDHLPAAIWTGVWLKACSHESYPSNVDRYIDRGDPSKRQPFIRTKQKSFDECVEWLTSLTSDPSIAPIANKQLIEQAKSRWPGLIGDYQYNECRKEALRRISPEQRKLWTKAGRKSKFN